MPVIPETAKSGKLHYTLVPPWLRGRERAKVLPRALYAWQAFHQHIVRNTSDSSSSSRGYSHVSNAGRRINCYQA